VAEGPGLIRLAVFGQPVAHSLSPRIHAQFARQCGLEVDYRAIEATADTFPDRVRELAGQGGRGCNVTVPFKHAAWRLAERRSERSDLAEAANTLCFDADGWFADNTDGGGLLFDLEIGAGFSLEGARICLLGAGGAAAGVTAALLQARPSLLLIANRSASRAAALAERHVRLGAVRGAGLDAIEAHGPFDLVVNATSLGHDGGAPGIRANWLQSDGLCYDMNYSRAAEPLRAACERAGLNYRDGFGMLVGQAALSFELWTGQRPDPLPVIEGLRDAARE
jgi:shikimate dehydrogenase